MVKIQTRDQLIKYLSDRLQFIGRHGISRALDGGIVRSLGGFISIPPGNASGWIVSITSRHGKTWRIAVIPKGNGYGLRSLDKVPWASWTGGKTELYLGDDPERYMRLRNEHRDKCI